MTGEASMWKLGKVRSNAKGCKFLCMEPLFWQSEASLEIPWEPRTFSEGPSVSFDNRRALWERAEADLVEQLAARLRRKAHARGRAPAAAALCEAIARRRLDAESQAAGPRVLLERRRHVCGPPRQAGSLRRAR